MKTGWIPQVFKVGVLGTLYFFPNKVFCQKQCPAKQDYLTPDAPDSIKDECAKAERKFKALLASSNPKALKDPKVLRYAGLRIESSWNGFLDTDSIRYWITYYRCFDSGFLTVLKTNKKGKMILVWQSPDIGSELSGLQEPKDLVIAQQNGLNLYYWVGAMDVSPMRGWLVVGAFGWAA